MKAASVQSLLETLSRLGASIASVLFVLAGVMLTYEVIARYFFIKPTRWAAELSQMCLIWGSLLAMAWLLEKRQHIQVDAVVNLLPRRVGRWLDVIVMLIVAIFAAVVMWYGFEIFLDSFVRGRTTGSLLNIPIWIVELAVPVGFAMLLMQSVIEIFKLLGNSSDTVANGTSTGTHASHSGADL